jgi:tRNA threonylcarbamoyladenosine biosynthesis protein TsaB
MQASEPNGAGAPDRILLAIDTCGATGTVALARSNCAEYLSGAECLLLGQTELEARSFSATLVKAVADLLGAQGVAGPDAILVVNGPGSFTGVRVGLSAAKGFAEAWQVPVAVVSRLEVLAAKSGEANAALDAHRHELYLRLGADGHPPREFLAGVAELKAMAPARVAVCDEAAAALLESAWAGVECIRTAAPTAADAIVHFSRRVLLDKIVDLALLDGHYLRRSDAEIFGEAKEA